MEFSVRVRAPAKINLHLEVLRKRQDGFHDLSSLFQTMDLHDDIVISSLKIQDTTEIFGDFDCPPDKTTIWKAVSLFRRATGMEQGISISVTKRIPAGAGLGGGSSDAAAVLLALDAIFGHPLDHASLSLLASAIGSDVPFFLSGGAALVSGRGEYIEPIHPRDDFGIVLIYPGFPVSTAWAYSLWDRMLGLTRSEPTLSSIDLVRIYDKDPILWSFSNSFLRVVQMEHPPIANLIQLLRESGARFASMSGSGSSLFGIFPSRDAASSGADTVREAILSMATDLSSSRMLVTACSPLVSTSELAYH